MCPQAALASTVALSLTVSPIILRKRVIEDFEITVMFWYTSVMCKMVYVQLMRYKNIYMYMHQSINMSLCHIILTIT